MKDMLHPRVKDVSVNVITAESFVAQVALKTQTKYERQWIITI